MFKGLFGSTEQLEENAFARAICELASSVVNEDEVLELPAEDDALVQVVGTPLLGNWPTTDWRLRPGPLKLYRSGRRLQLSCAKLRRSAANGSEGRTFMALSLVEPLLLVQPDHIAERCRDQIIAALGLSGSSRTR